MSWFYIYMLCPLACASSYYYLHHVQSYHVLYCVVCSLMVGYFPAYFNTSYNTDGMLWKSFQRSKRWRHFANYFDSKVTTETELDPKQLYIYCSFPHGIGMYCLNNCISFHLSLMWSRNVAEFIIRFC